LDRVGRDSGIDVGRIDLHKLEILLLIIIVSSVTSVQYPISAFNLIIGFTNVSRAKCFTLVYTFFDRFTVETRPDLTDLATFVPTLAEIREEGRENGNRTAGITVLLADDVDVLGENGSNEENHN